MESTHKYKKWITSAFPIQIMVHMAMDLEYIPSLADFKEEVTRIAGLEAGNREAVPDHGHYTPLYNTISNSKDSEGKWLEYFHKKREYSKSYVCYC
jgi:hypothetical protein